MAAPPLRIAYIGRRAQDPWLDAAHAYAAKLRRWCALELLMLREGPAERERQALLAAIRPGDTVIALDERGEQHTTASMHEQLHTLQQLHHAQLCFLVGGASGLGDEVRRRSTKLWALSALTLPHRAALAIVLEQLYRCASIARGTPYHRAG